VARYAGTPELTAAVEAAVRVTQNTEEACTYAAAAAVILEACILGTPPHDAVRQLRDSSQCSTLVGTALAQLLECHTDHRDWSCEQVAAAVGRGAKVGGLG